MHITAACFVAMLAIGMLLISARFLLADMLALLSITLYEPPVQQVSECEANCQACTAHFTVSGYLNASLHKMLMCHN